LSFTANLSNPLVQKIASTLLALFSNGWFYSSLYFVLVLVFTYFYTAVTFEPESVATNLQKNGAFVPLLRAIPGLTLLPHPSSRALLYGASGGTLTLFARTSATSTSGSLPIRTTADKCVWDPKQQFIAYCAVPQSLPAPSFLDRWYRGEVHTADAWWRVDAGAASAELLFSPGNAVLDVERPVIDNSGNYIAFVNAVDKSLWLLRIEEQ